MTVKSSLKSQLKTILVIEDDAQDYMLETRNLAEDHFPLEAVTRANCLAEASLVLKDARFDAILLDMNVGDSSGLETFTRVYAMASDTPIVILSGVEGDQIASLAVSKGAQDFVLKKNPLSIGLKKTLEFACERNEMLKALKESREEAQRHTEFKSRFLAQMSHEIRTPMNGVIGIAQLLYLSPNLSEDDKELVSSLKATSKHLIDLISDILDLSKVEAGKTVLETVTFNLRDLVEDSLRALVPIAEEKDLVLADLIAPRIVTNYTGDLNHIRQVLLNLLGNAVKFTKEGMITVMVEKQESRGDRPQNEMLVKFSVRDSGRGISKEKIEDLFKPFSQVIAQNEAVLQGTGLGLSISKALVELMGGTIGAESEEGKGSTFWFILPLIAEEKIAEVRTNFVKKQAFIFSQNADRSQILSEQMRMRGLIPSQVDSLASLKGQSEGFLLMDMPRSAQARTELMEAVLPDTMSTVFLGRVSDRDVAMEGKAKVNGALLQQELYQEMAHFSESLDGLKRKKGANEELGQNRRFAKLKAMIVDDNKLNHDVASRMLKVIEMKCECFEDGPSALKALQTSHFDVVLMDCKMPGMDGFEATRLIRTSLPEALRSIPVIALTANAFAEDKERCLAAGMNDFLSKPLMFKDLIDVLNTSVPDKETIAMSTSNDRFNKLVRIDESIIMSLKLLEEPQEAGAFVNGLIMTFNEDAPVACQRLCEAMQKKGLSEIEHYSHKLKGLCRNLGAVRLSEICNTMERSAAWDKQMPEADLAPLASQELDELINTLSKYYVLKAA